MVSYFFPISYICIIFAFFYYSQLSSFICQISLFAILIFWDYVFSAMISFSSSNFEKFISIGELGIQGNINHI